MSTHHKRGIGALLAVAALVALALPGVARADAVTDWNAIAASTILAPPAPTAHASVLNSAMVQGAVYDAVNAIARTHRAYLLDIDEVGAQPWDSKNAAAATAAYRVLAALYPAQQPTLEGQWLASLGPLPYDRMTQGGMAAGEAAAAAMLEARANDGRNGPFTFAIGNAPGNWRPLTPTALDPTAWVGNVRPFLMKSPSQFRSEGPNALTSGEYAEDFNEVKELGALNSTKRTADQTYAAIFWQTQPVALWGGLMRSLSARRNLGIAKNARMFAMASLAAADGSISCWNDKYYWKFWRPLPAIREAGTDGNPNTVADPSWKALFDPSTQTVPPLATPPFPDHPSGHGCISGATLQTLRAFFGTDKIGFDLFSSRYPGQARHFDRFSLALKEIIDARVWGGIHFRTADVQGAVMGKKVAQYMRKNYFQPIAR